MAFGGSYGGEARELRVLLAARITGDRELGAVGQPDAARVEQMTGQADKDYRRVVKTVVVLAGGPDGPAGFALPAGATVIAADSGAELGVPVDLAVGDFDSISAETLASLERVEPHPPDKDATDLELALDAALRFTPERIVVAGSAGGRLDHLFGSLLLLAADAYAGVQVDAQLGGAAVHVVRGQRTLYGEPGELISLFAVHGPAEGVVTDGLVYSLQDETLDPGSSRGTSNAFAAAEVRVSLVRGVLLALRPSGSVWAGTSLWRRPTRRFGA